MNHLRLIQKPLLTKKRLAALFSIFLVALTATPLVAQAGIKEYVAAAIGWIATLICELLGGLIVLVMHVLISVAQYNDFIGLGGGSTHPVEIGWVILRDLSNMFFIVVLLVIAFGTMLGVKEEYNYRKALPKLLVMAIFINFSRTITGLVIDAAQVLMLTFVNAFKDAAAGNLVSMLGINQLFSIREDATVSLGNVVITYLLAIIFLIVVLATVFVITLTLIARIVALWMLTIFSPLAFFLSAVPTSKAQKVYSDWWEKLICWAGSGAVLGFFLWLALATASQGGPNLGLTSSTLTERQQYKPEGFVSEVASEPNIIRFLIGIAMLVYGLQASKDFCGVGVGMMSGLAKSAQNKAVGYAKAAGRWGAGKAWKHRGAVGAGVVAGATGGLGLGVYGGIAAAIGVKAAKRGIYKGAAGKQGFLGTIARDVTGVGPRALAYRLLGRFGPAASRRAGQSLLAGAQQKTDEIYSNRAKAAQTAAAKNPALFAKHVLRPPKIASPEADITHAADMTEALTSSRIKDEMKTIDPNGRKRLYDAMASTAGRNPQNKKMQDDLKMVRQANPDLMIGDKTMDTDNGRKERVKILNGLSGEDALKLDISSLQNKEVADNLSHGARRHILESDEKDKRTALISGMSDNEKRKFGEQMSANAVLRMKPEILLNGNFVSGLREKVIEEILKKGSQAQIDALSVGRAAATPVTTTPTAPAPAPAATAALPSGTREIDLSGEDASSLELETTPYRASAPPTTPPAAPPAGGPPTTPPLDITSLTTKLEDLGSNITSAIAAIKPAHLSTPDSAREIANGLGRVIQALLAGGASEQARARQIIAAINSSGLRTNIMHGNNATLNSLLIAPGAAPATTPAPGPGGRRRR